MFSRVYEKGQVMYQYQTEKGQVGNFFVESTSTIPEEVGLLSKDYVRIFKVELTEKVEVLVTKHGKGLEYWQDGKTITKGGGEQLFSTEVKNKAIITEIPPPKQP